MKKLVSILLVGFLFIISSSAAQAAPFPGINYDLSSKKRLNPRGEFCATPSQPKSSSVRSALLQVWVHPGAKSVYINGKKARQPKYFDISNDQRTVILQGWVVRANIPKAKKRFQVRASGFALTASGTKKNWSVSKSILFSDTIPYWGKLRYSREFNGICNIKV